MVQTFVINYFTDPLQQSIERSGCVPKMTKKKLNLVYNMITYQFEQKHYTLTTLGSLHKLNIHN